MRQGSHGADAAGYAQREQQSPKAAQFEGGSSTIYIGGGVVTVLLVVILGRAKKTAGANTPAADSHFLAASDASREAWNRTAR